VQSLFWYFLVFSHKNQNYSVYLNKVLDRFPVNDSVKQAIALVGISRTRHAGRAQAIEQNCFPTYSK